MFVLFLLNLFLEGWRDANQFSLVICAYFYKNITLLYFYFTPHPSPKGCYDQKNIKDTGLDKKNESEKGRRKINMNLETGLKELDGQKNREGHEYENLKDNSSFFSCLPG